MKPVCRCTLRDMPGHVSEWCDDLQVDEPNHDGQETVSSWTNPYTAEYKRRQAMLMAMRPFELIAMLRDLNLTSYAFSKNAEELQAHVAQFPQIGNSQPFNPDVGDPFAIELAYLQICCVR